MNTIVSKRIAVCSLASLLLFGLTACNTGSAEIDVTSTAGIETASRSETDSWYTVDGSTLTVTLEGNPTTGYEWTGKVDNPGVLSISEGEYKPYAAADGVTGSGGVYEFTVTPVSEGAAQARFSYARSWEVDELGEEAVVEAKLLSVGVASDGSLHVMEIEIPETTLASN